MILIKYSKLHGAEFISHLDTLRHLGKIVRRTGIKVNYSNGFNPHMLIYMSSPIPLGMKSTSELCLIDTSESVLGFKELFNEKSPKGIKCVEAYETTKKVNVVSDVESAVYEITGLNKFDENEILSLNSFIVADKKKGEKEARDKIISLSWKDDVLICNFKFGNDNLRPDAFIEKVKGLYGGNHVTVVKTGVVFKGNKTLKEYLEI
ncbi:MAG: DUF2344 domain-containing protein [Clostridia bacterium]|nr:DUF2344 domain-containing protein [Clostridia bacterium]